MSEEREQEAKSQEAFCKSLINSLSSRKIMSAPTVPRKKISKARRLWNGFKGLKVAWVCDHLD